MAGGSLSSERLPWHGGRGDPGEVNAASARLRSRRRPPGPGGLAAPAERAAEARRWSWPPCEGARNAAACAERGEATSCLQGTRCRAGAGPGAGGVAGCPPRCCPHVPQTCSGASCLAPSMSRAVPKENVTSAHLVGAAGWREGRRAQRRGTGQRICWGGGQWVSARLQPCTRQGPSPLGRNRRPRLLTHAGSRTPVPAPAPAPGAGQQQAEGKRFLIPNPIPLQHEPIFLSLF